MEVYVARQPIFDTDNQVFAYELLYRQNEKNFFDGSVTSNVATSVLLMNSYYTFGIDNLVGEGKAFINFDKYLVEADIPQLLDKEKVVVELLEDIKPDRFFMSKIRELKEKGYTIAVDDYVEGYIYTDLVDLADIIKVDFFENTRADIAKIAKEWKAKGKILLAEKVETQEVFEWSKGLGYNLFQGYYFSKPAMMKAKGMNDSSYQFIRIMDELSAKEPDYKKIAAIIETDVTLTYKLLKLVNSNFTSSRAINSIQHGLAILGIRSFEKWFSLAMVQSMGQDKPSELTKLSMLRGHFMERIAENSTLKNNSNEMMLVGILSVIDALLEKPMEEVTQELPLADEIKNALVFLPGKYTEVYNMVLEVEKGNFDVIAPCCETIGLEEEKVYTYYYDSVKWAEEVFGYMKADS